MNNKKWIKFFYMFSFLGICSIWCINYIVDPFNVFDSKILNHSFQMNERFAKIKFIDKNHKKFNSYMFGSSRIGTTNPRIIEKYTKNSKFYNMSVSSANLEDYLLFLEYFLKNDYEIKNLYLQIDIENMYTFGLDRSDYLRRHHPSVLNESNSLYYLEYLSGLFFTNIKGKIIKNLEPKVTQEYFISSGIWTRSEKEKLIINDCKKYIKNISSFNQKNSREIGMIRKEVLISSLSKIVKLSKDNNINLIVFTTPHNKNMLDKFKIKDYIQFLTLIAEKVNFYDFSYYNRVTLNNCNYYEYSHYRPKVAKLIAARIFKDKTVHIPNDFGVLVTNKNIIEHTNKLKNLTKEYDEKK